MEKKMLTMDDCIEFGMVKFEDKRAACRSCTNVSFKGWKGKCNAGHVQFMDILNNCSDYKEKVQTADGNFWE
jgi:hypothetical protein